MKTISIRTDSGHFGWHAYTGECGHHEWATHHDERTAAWKAALTAFYGKEPKGGRLFTQAVSVFVVPTGPRLWRAIQLNTDIMHHEAAHLMKCADTHDAKTRTNHRRNIARILKPRS